MAQPGDHYLGFVAFGLGGLVFVCSISDGAPDVSERALDLCRQPRKWFPVSYKWLSPTETNPPQLRLLSEPEELVSGLSLALRMGLEKPLDALGREVDALAVIPKKFHAKLKWDGCDIID